MQINHLKGVILFNINVFTASVQYLLSKVLYHRHPTLQPSQLLTVRGIIATIFGFLYVNKDIKLAMWDGVPEGNTFLLIQRIMCNCLSVIINFTVIKYMSLIYVGVAQNLSPLLIVVMSYFCLGERINKQDLVLLFVTFVGVVIVIYGMSVERGVYRGR